MTVESNYVIAIATLSDWLKRLAPVFQPMRRETKPNRTMYAWFFRTSRKLLVIGRNCDWFIALSAPVVIGRSNCFGFGFFDSHLKTALSPPKFKVCFRCSSLSFNLVLHHATVEFYIQHCCLRCDIGVSQWDMGVLTSNIQVLTFNIQVLNWTSRMKRIHWECWAQEVTQAWHKTHRSLHGSMCRMD